MLAGYVRPASRSDAVRFQFDQIVTARITLARVLWLQGYADRALRVIEDNIAEATALNHTLSICNALAQSACPVALLAGDFERADRYLRLLIDLTASEGLVIWRTYSACFSGELLWRRGEQEDGLRLLRAGVDELRAAKFVQYHTAFLGALAEGLAAAGHVAEALAAIDEALSRADQNSERWCLAELLRIKGDILLRAEPAGVATATNELYDLALDLARGQGALSWELRAAMGVARLRYTEGRPAEGRQALESVHARFSEGFGTADLIAARTLLDALA
jgi:predicted ATPase